MLDFARSERALLFLRSELTLLFDGWYFAGKDYSITSTLTHLEVEDLPTAGALVPLQIQSCYDNTLYMYATCNVCFSGRLACAAAAKLECQKRARLFRVKIGQASAEPDGQAPTPL